MNGEVAVAEETKQSVAAENEVLGGKPVDEESSEKQDSGMDEEMTELSPAAPDLDSDSDDEPVVCRKKTKKKMVVDDDDEDDDDDVSAGPNTELSENLGSVSDKSDDCENSDLGMEIVTTKKTLSEALAAVMESDSDSDAELTKPKDGTSQKKSMLFNSDLFDAEESDSGSDCNRDNKDGDGDDSSNNSADDEGFDESSIDPKLRAKLLKMKGAAKKDGKNLGRGSERRAKPKPDSLLDIHSESQRLLRESRVMIPYHQPTPKPLNDFLARAAQKQQEYKALRAVREFKKPSVLQHVIANCSPDIIPTPVNKKHKSTTEPSSSRTRKPETNTPSVEETNTHETLTVESVSKKIDFDDDDDDLPDLYSDKYPSVVVKSTVLDTCGEVTESVVDAGSSSVDCEHDDDQEDEGMCVDSADKCVDSADKCVAVSATVNDNVNDEPTTTSVHDEDDVDNSSTSNTMNRDSENVFPLASQTEHREAETEGVEGSVIEGGDIPCSRQETPRLQVLSSVRDVTPILSGSPHSFIDLEDEDESPAVAGRNKLMDRLIRHSKKKKTHKKPKDVDISIIEKDEKDGEPTELVMTSITYHVDEEEELSNSQLDKPGAKLLALKERLQTGMRARREEVRQRRLEMYALENEEGFGNDTDNEEEKLLDDDAEMSEKSDTDIEDDQFDAEFGEEEYEEEGEDREESRGTNMFLDGQAREDDGEDSDFCPDAAREEDSDEDSEDDDVNVQLKLDTSEEEGADSDLENPSQNLRCSSLKKHKPVRQLILSDDEGSNLPTDSNAAKPVAMETASFKIPKDSLDEEDELSPLSKHLSTTQTQKCQTLSLPVEDSQDLYSGATDSFGTDPRETLPSQNYHFLTEDSQSQMLDADGFFKIKSTAKKPSRTSLGLNDISNTQDNMNELMGLCSGRFKESQDSSKKSSCKQLFNDGTDAPSLASTQGISNELLGLCSGFFPNSETSTGQKRKLDDEEEDASNASFTVMSDKEDLMASDQDELADEEDAQSDVDEVDGDNPTSKFNGFRGKITGMLRREFIEEEAELSGSDAESDEDLDLAEEDDVMEMELGDLDVKLSEEELRNQVGRVHLKETIDADKRDILRLQEMYLPDGDLYSDGAGRKRNFRWKNMDDESQQDMFGEGSDCEGQEEEADELKWRMERFQREKFLQEEREKEENENTGSQFYNFGKKFALKIMDPFKKTSDKDGKQQQDKSKASTKPVLKQMKPRKGSFLTRGKEALAKIAQHTKLTVNTTASRNSRNFVFQVVSPEKSEAPQPKTVTRPSKSVKKSPSLKPPAKRQRTKTAPGKSGSSIFNILET